MPMLGHNLSSLESLQSTLWWLILQRDASVELVSQNIASNLSPIRTHEGINMKNEQGIMSWDKWKPYARWSWYLHMTAGVVPWCQFSPWRLFSCSMDTPTIWTESVLLSPSTDVCLTPSSDSSSILHEALYPSLEFWQFSLDTRSGPLDSGASYPLGASIVRALHHSGWCTASSTALKSCLYQHHLLLTRLLETTLFIWLFWPVCSFYHTNWFFTIWSVVLATHHHPFLAQWWIKQYGHGMHWPWRTRCFWIGFPDSIPLCTPFMWTMAFIQYSLGWWQPCTFSCGRPSLCFH